MAPPQGQMRPGRQLAVLGLLFVVLYLLVFFAAGAKGSFTDRLEPRLGLDLIGGTRVTYVASTATGDVPPPNNLEQAREIIESRVNGLGVSEAEVVIEGDRNIVVSLAGEPDNRLDDVGDPAQLRFRKVLKVTADTGPAQPQPSGSATPTGSAAPKPTGNANASAAPDASAAPQPSASGGQGGGAPAPSVTPSATPSATPTAAAEVDGFAKLTPEQQLAAVRKKVGEEAWKAATALQAPADASQTKVLKPFETLTGPEVAVLPPAVQFNVPAITCEKLHGRPAGAIDDVTKQVVACDAATKYLLDVAKVQGTDVDDANAVLDQTQNEWVVSLDFTSDGQAKWTALTREAFNNEGQACDQSALGDQQKCLVAVVLDKEVVSAPQILGVLTSQSQISGDFNPVDARKLANQLKYGALPLTFERGEAQVVTATLGTQYLQAGLIAMGIGLLLVALYAFFYYRLLGSVILLSLVLSGLLIFGAIVFLGRSIGFTLTLAGIAGLIVSLGVAADSFVIYFERLKDEIREGRSPRSAVPRAWARARRTIISANAISILAAIVLYLVTVGTVKGFAFALGLATILDLVVVFLFRHPIMAMFARTPAFLSPRVSGLGRAMREAAPAAAPSTTTRRAKEA